MSNIPIHGATASIRQHLNELTPSELRVAEYVSSQKLLLIDQSMIDIANNAGVSDATVLRFVRSIGFDSFKSFKIALMAEQITPSESIFESVQTGDSAADILRKVVLANIQLLQDTLDVIDPDMLNAAVAEINKAKRIIICGVGSSTPMVMWLFDRLFRLGYFALALTDSHQQLMQASMAEDGDVFIVISRSGGSANLCEIFRLVKKHSPKCKRIIITCDKYSPAAKLSNICLQGMSREVRSDISGSYASISSIIDVIYTCLELANANKTVSFQQNAWSAIDSLRAQKIKGESDSQDV